MVRKTASEDEEACRQLSILHAAVQRGPLCVKEGIQINSSPDCNSVVIDSNDSNNHTFFELVSVFIRSTSLFLWKQTHPLSNGIPCVFHPKPSLSNRLVMQNCQLQRTLLIMLFNFFLSSSHQRSTRLCQREFSDQIILVSDQDHTLLI